MMRSQQNISTLRQLLEDRANSIFECNYLEDFSLLKQGLPPEAYLKI